MVKFQQNNNNDNNNKKNKIKKKFMVSSTFCQICNDYRIYQLNFNAPYHPHKRANLFGPLTACARASF